MATFTYRQTIRTINCDGKTIEETVETSDGINNQSARERADSIIKDADQQFRRMEKLFTAIDKAFEDNPLS